MAGGDFDLCDCCCLSSVAALGHIDSNVRMFIYSSHNRLAILLEVPIDGKLDCLE